MTVTPPSQLGKKFPNRKRPAPLSEQHRLKISKALTGIKRSEETRLKLSKIRKGMQFSDEHRRNISKSLIGNKRARGSVKTPKMRQAISERTRGKHTGQENNNWKGDNVGYYALHDWVIRQLDRPSQCEACDTTESKRFEWANISGEYQRDLSDWVRLCSECHHRFDDQSRKASETRRLNRVQEVV